MDYNILSAAKMPDLIVQVNQAILNGWLPMEGGFQVQNFTDSSTRYLQTMVKIYPWSIKSMQALMSATPMLQEQERLTIEAAPEKKIPPKKASERPKKPTKPEKSKKSKRKASSKR